MDPISATLSLIVMFTLVLLLVGVLYSRLHWTLKAGLIVLSMGAAVLSFHTFRESRGWPVVMAEAPDLFQFISGVAREPNPERQDKGALIFWIVEPGKKEPRAITLPYSRENHKKMEQAKGKAAKGETVHMGKKAEGQGQGSGKGEGAGRGGTGKGGKGGQGQGAGQGQGPGSGGRDTTGGLIDFVMPQSDLPSKD